MTDRNNSQPDKPKTAYQGKLLDPRWQKRRLSVFERDGWRCQHCLGSKETLHVHHRWYSPGAEPWDVPDEALVTLCATCHKDEENERDNVGRCVLFQLRRHLLWTEMHCIAHLLSKMPRDVVVALAAGGVSPENFSVVEEWMARVRKPLLEGGGWEPLSAEDRDRLVSVLDRLDYIEDGR